MLRGPRIHLRTIRSKDLTTFLELTSDLDARGQFFPRDVSTETAIKNRFDKDGFWSDDLGMMLIVENESDHILGMIVFFKPVHYYQAVEVGYILYDREKRGKGIVPEAVCLFVKYLFSWKPIHRVQLQIDSRNEASRRVAVKCGFKHEGTARQAVISDGVPVDLDVFSILRCEFEELKVVA